jgi:hypothetical protein
MASQAYHDWVAAGKPWKIARPIQMVGNRLRAHGYTVYYQGNQSHLEHVPPEDHTPFSATGWPAKSPYPYCMAMDIMPPDAGQKSKLTGKPLPSLQQLAARLRADKNTNYGPAEFLKYMNWEPEGNNTGPCYHETWMPTYARRTSGDRGHIHASCRSDMHTSTVSDGYDLVARVMGDDDMSVADVKTGILEVFAEAANATDDDATNDTQGGRNLRRYLDAVMDFSNTAGPLAESVKALTALVVQQSSATAADIAAALAPLIHVQDGATADEVEERIRKVLGGLDNTQS